MAEHHLSRDGGRLPRVYADATHSDDPTNVGFFQDAGGQVNGAAATRSPLVFDNRIHPGRMPVTIAIPITTGPFPPAAEC